MKALIPRLNLIRRIPIQWIFAYGGLLMASLILRVLSANNDLWLDEIWSLNIAHRARSGLDILFHNKIDNNHFLNTLILHWLPPHSGSLLYRAPACLAGVLGVLFAIRIGLRKGPRCGFFLGYITCFAYFLIHYSSEARGYAYLILFSLVALDCVLEERKCPSAWNRCLFLMATVMGMLSHATFLAVIAGLFIGSLFHLENTSLLDQVRRHALFWSGPILAVLFVLFFLLSGMRVGGGNSIAPSEALLKTAGWAMLGNASQVCCWLGVGLFVLLILWIIFLHRNLPLLFGGAVTLIIIPSLLLIATSRPDLPYPRYWLVQVLFLYILLAGVLDWFWQKGRICKIATVAFLTIWTWTNLRATCHLIQVGRGSYTEAIREVCRQQNPTLGGFGDFSGDFRNDFRNEMILNYYSPRLEGASQPNYFRIGSWSWVDPKWVLVISFGDDTRWRQPILRLPGPVDLTLYKFYPSVELSGWNWSLYQRRISVKPSS
jgi:hypothetical protein